MRIVIIGTGNVAHVLGRKIQDAGHDILQVAGRNEPAAVTLAAMFNCPFTVNWDYINLQADLYIVAISDAALENISTQLQLGKKLVVHTAGAVSKNVLKDVSTNYGVLYPLQSIRKERITIPAIPFLTDANTADDLTLIKDFAATLSDKVEVATDLERKKMHLAAVLVNNFTNHLYTLAADYCKKESIDFGMLFPLIKETADRIDNISPVIVQTGPAARGDKNTIKMHLQLLSTYPQLKILYEIFTASIEAAGKNQVTNDLL